MSVKAKLTSQKGGRSIIPNENTYYLARVILGASAYIYDTVSNDVFRTSIVEDILMYDNEIIITTKNTRYTFELVGPND